MHANSIYPWEINAGRCKRTRIFCTQSTALIEDGLSPIHGVLMYNDATSVDKVPEEAHHTVNIFSKHNSTALTQTKLQYLQLHYSHDCCCGLLVHQCNQATITSALPFEKAP